MSGIPSRLVPLLVSGMLFTGTINTLLNKYQDFTCVKDCDTSPVLFEQPLLQTLNMFVGEVLCLVVYFLLERRTEYTLVQDEPEVEVGVGDSMEDRVEDQDEEEHVQQQTLTTKSQFWFLVPTLCDLLATTLMNVGLLYVPASVYQMLRGSVVIFTALFSILFLKIRMGKVKLGSVGLVFLGVCIVGLSSIIQTSKPADGFHTLDVGMPVVGTLLIILAQMFTASQFVIEERIMKRYTVAPLRAVGLEGLFGLLITLIAIPTLHLFIGQYSPGSTFDMFESWRQLQITQVWTSALGICMSISLFNWCGLAVTQSVSATARATIDTTRTLFIWIVSLMLGWETFKGLQVLGFLVLVLGTFIFNNVIKI